jgi:hypothetical protein
MRIQNLIASLIIFSCVGSALACPSPWKPVVTYEEGIGIGGASLNTYATGAKMCIVMGAYCPECREGYRHECMASGKWRPYEACSEGDLNSARSTASAAISAAAGNRGVGNRASESSARLGAASAVGETHSGDNVSIGASSGASNSSFNSDNVDSGECTSIRDQAQTSAQQSRTMVSQMRSLSPEAGNLQQANADMWTAIASASCPDLLRANPTLQKLYNVDPSPQGMARMEQELYSLPTSVRDPVLRHWKAMRALTGQ